MGKFVSNPTLIFDFYEGFEFTSYGQENLYGKSIIINIGTRIAIGNFFFNEKVKKSETGKINSEMLSASLSLKFKTYFSTILLQRHSSKNFP